MTVEELLIWARAHNLKVRAARIAQKEKKEQESFEFRSALKEEINDNEFGDYVDKYMKRLFVAWYWFGVPIPRIIIDI